jgi:predicted metal-dependent enzyme (double-stranded beta helix superfamily)
MSQMFAAERADDPLASLRNLGSEGTLAQEYLDRTRAVLQDFVQRSELVSFSALRREPGRYTRTLLFGNDELSVWAIVWPPGVRTSIHDHHCSCCFAVLRGQLEERWFRSVSGTRVVRSKLAVRQPGYVACMLPSGPNIHQMANESNEDAISVHVYGYDHRAKESSIEREYLCVDSIN